MVNQFDGGWQKRPKKATPEWLLARKQAGVSVQELAAICGISRTMVYRLLERARQAHAAERVVVSNA